MTLAASECITFDRFNKENEKGLEIEREGEGGSSETPQLVSHDILEKGKFIVEGMLSEPLEE